MLVLAGQPKQTFVLPPFDILQRACSLVSKDKMMEIAREAWIKAGGNANVQVVFSEMVPPERWVSDES